MKKFIKKKEFCVYVLLDTRKPFYEKNGKKFIYKNSRYSSGIDYKFSFEPFYVGKGKIERPKDHIAEAKNTKHSRFVINKIRKIITSEGREPEIFYVKKGLTEKQAFSLEHKLCFNRHRTMFLIKSIKRDREAQGPLTNNSEGGVGKESGWKHSEEAKKKMKGRVVSKEWREKHSKFMKGKKKLSDAMKGNILVEF